MLSTTSGPVVGSVADGISVFTGIRYGRLADGRRFAPVASALEDSKQDLRDLTAVFPQLPSRLRGVMGSAVERHPQEEDAFLLNIWAPVGRSGLPVLLFVHGGAFVSGGGGVRWYNGTVLARDGGMVVVTVNYRLGPLAHLLFATDDDPNRATGDLAEALRWLRANIEVFGGDPDNITLAGQSAGGFHSQLLAVLPSSRDMVRRLLLMSTPGFPAATRATTRQLGSDVVAGLGGADPRTVPVAELLAAGRVATMKDSSLGRVANGLLPTVDRVVPGWLDSPGRVAAELRVTDLLITHTRDETGSFFFAAPERHITRDQLGEMYDAGSATTDPYEDLVRLTTARRFGIHARQLAAAAAARGVTTRLREFTLSSPLDGVGSGHCFDIPFFFGNWDDWHDAPMLRGFDRDQFDEESGRLRVVVADLVHGKLVDASNVPPVTGSHHSTTPPTVSRGR